MWGEGQTGAQDDAQVSAGITRMAKTGGTFCAGKMIRSV